MVTLLGPAELRDLADLLDLRPTKKLGQNFVHDANTVRRIVRAAGVEAGDEVLEVGPGLGSLTLGLLEAGARVTAVEVDPRLAARLPLTVAELAPDAALTVLEADAMHLSNAHLSSAHPSNAHPGEVSTHPRRLVANLPYNVSVPVLLHLLALLDLESALVMVQAEVGERIAAPPGSRVYGSPSAKAAWFGEWTLAGRVSRAVFWPVPNVDSVLVGYRRGPLHGTDDERRATFALVDAAFGQRRKMLRQSLREALGADAVGVLERAHVDPTDRAEQLGIDAFLRIARVAAGG